MEEQSPINFWGIGAQKAGTSWLYYNLNKTPGFIIPPVKEMHYFDRDTKYPSPNILSQSRVIDRLKSFSYIKKAARSIIATIVKGKLKNLGFTLKWFFSNYSDDWYISVFAPLKGIKGEITPSYSMLNTDDIARMHAMAPDAKLILMLRNPIDRAWSHFRHTKKGIKGFKLDDVKDHDIIEFMQSEGQELRSNYMRTISNFTSVFPKEQLLIGFFDAIMDAPEQLLEEVIQFLSSKNGAKETSKKSWDVNDSAINKVVNKSIELDCPPAVLTYLKEKYHDMSLELANQYGGYFNKWYAETYDKTSDNPDNRLFPTIFLS